VIQLLNPNGWYCFRTTVNVMGGLTIKAHCKAHLATTSGDVLGAADEGKKGVTVMGSTQVERVECD
jgi:cobalamin synthase